MGKKSRTTEERLRQEIWRLFKSQILAVLATSDAGHPYSSLVAFLVSEDLSYIIFATSRDTRKFASMALDPRVSLLMDNRTNRDVDFEKAIAITVLGTAREMSATERLMYEERFLERFPRLTDFVKAPDCALMMVRVSKYLVVGQFQKVVVLEIS